MQLLALKNKRELQGYAHKHFQAYSKELRIYQHDTSWYALILGEYKTQQEAAEALKKLPPHLQHLNPWVRSFGVIQKQIAKQFPDKIASKRALAKAKKTPNSVPKKVDPSKPLRKLSLSTNPYTPDRKIVDFYAG